MALLLSTNIYWLRFAKGAAATLALFALFGCNGPKRLSAYEEMRAEYCPEAHVRHEYQETPYYGKEAIILSFQSIRARVNTACQNCHQAPSNTGGFTYIDEFQGKVATYNGVTQWYPGFADVAEKMHAYMVHANEDKRMPPKAQRAKNPDSFLEIARQIEMWIKAGKPEGTFESGKAPAQRRGKETPILPVHTSELGDCIPTAKAVGTDLSLDRQFEKATELPKFLNQTDLFSLDPFQLAQHGTLAYNVEYPLWADNAEKGRWIHVPMAMVDGKLQKQSVDFDAVKGQFRIPDNTRFYKTFYRAIKLPNGQTRMRRMETRLIVTRTPWQKALFGSYQWDESEQVATLVDAPYRDGTPWADQKFDVTIDLASEATRPYAIPGRQRCIDCHMGSPMQNFVLGFQPIQLNKRPFGFGGRVEQPSDHDLDQVQRFISYGLLSGIKSADELPVLEKAGGVAPRNEYEVRANGYTVGNCYHCHNPQGLAFTKENGIKLQLGPGDLFQFDTHRKAEEYGRIFVHQNGELDNSYIWRKVSDPQSQQGIFNQMPMHTPGSPSCKVLDVMGRWIRSFESMAAANDFTPSCKKENEFFWIDLDFTWVQSENYTPRRADWNKPKEGMPDKFRALTLDPILEKAIQGEYAVGYWLDKPQECKFPEIDLPKDKQRPWMLAGGKPKRPFGQVYYTTPGSYFYRNTCSKCHGPKADGDSANARGILNWSGGKIRVANFMDGLFGKKNDNLKTFDVDGKNLAGNYLIWMAMEGTKVAFPPELSSMLGKHGGQMLFGIRDKCLSQISPEASSSPYLWDHEIYNKVCFMNNLAPGDPSLEFDEETSQPLHPEAVEAWLDRGAYNAGWAIFEFLKDASAGNWRPANDECERVYGSSQPQPQPTPAP